MLYGHCEKVGRDPAEITKTGMARIAIGRTHEEAQAKLQIMRDRGVSEEMIATVVAGDADTIAQRGQAMADAGLDGMTLSMPDVEDLEAVEMVGKALGPVFAASVS